MQSRKAELIAREKRDRAVWNATPEGRTLLLSEAAHRRAFETSFKKVQVMWGLSHGGGLGGV